MNDKLSCEIQEPILMTLDDASRWIKDGDLLLFRGWGAIAVAGRAEYCHAAKAAWWYDELFCLEMRFRHGGRAVTLQSQVQRFPGRIDLFQANPRRQWPHYNRRGAIQVMQRQCGRPYGFWSVIKTALLHAAIVRWFLKPDTNDNALDRHPVFCSQACAIADRLGGGVDPVPHLADRITEPSDLARSAFYKYRATLIP